jgi:hypothetical protein
VLQAQSKKDSVPDQTGFLSMGARNCVSAFISQGKMYVGTGAGGQFALRIAKNFNSHWFADWIVSNIANKAQRYDFHSGFSMMPEVYSPRVGKTHIALFPLAGICIDYTKLSATTGHVATGPSFLERYSFAIQAGIGATVPVSKRLDFSLEVHYMLHIGTCVGIDINGNDVYIHQMRPSENVCLEGHYVIAISVDYKMFRLWRKKAS